MLWSGILIGSTQLLIFILTLSRTVKSEIWLNEVKTIKVKQRLNNKFLDKNLQTTGIDKSFSLTMPMRLKILSGNISKQKEI